MMSNATLQHFKEAVLVRCWKSLERENVSDGKRGAGVFLTFCSAKCTLLQGTEALSLQPSPLPAGHFKTVLTKRAGFGEHQTHPCHCSEFCRNCSHAVELCKVLLLTYCITTNKIECGFNFSFPLSLDALSYHLVSYFRSLYSKSLFLWLRE